MSESIFNIDIEDRALDAYVRVISSLNKLIQELPKDPIVPKGLYGGNMYGMGADVGVKNNDRKLVEDFAQALEKSETQTKVYSTSIHKDIASGECEWVQCIRPDDNNVVINFWLTYQHKTKAYNLSYGIGKSCHLLKMRHIYHNEPNHIKKSIWYKFPLHTFKDSLSFLDE